VSVLNLYIPGIENDLREFKVVQSVLGKEGINNITNFYQEGRPKESFFKKAQKIEEGILERFLLQAGTSDINIIAQDVGCTEAALILGNLGTFDSDRKEQIRSATLMSFQFSDVSEVDSLIILNESERKYGKYDEYKKSLPLLDQILYNRRHLKLRESSYEMLDKTAVPYQLVYSDGDIYVDQIYMKVFAKITGKEMIVAESNSHNPLIGTDKENVAQKIKILIDNNKRR
jgi:hypothetical protein